jgi:protein-S-isoprenylcysteine O-methyltransferase Ste14
VIVRHEYQHKSKLSIWGCLLQFALFFLHALSAYFFFDPDFSKIDLKNPTFIPAMICIMPGLVLVALSLIQLGVSDSIGVKVSGLRQKGIYRYSRNPGIVASVPLYSGFVLLWPSWAGIIWLIDLWIMLHMMVLTEEEHLVHIFGDEYKQYCNRTPRYLGWVNKNVKHGNNQDQ